MCASSQKPRGGELCYHDSLPRRIEKKQKPRELRKTITNPVGAMCFGGLLKWKCMLLLPQKTHRTLSDEKGAGATRCGNANVDDVLFCPEANVYINAVNN